jgi:predicted Zn-dependent protease
MRTMLRRPFHLLAVLALAACAVNPATGERQLSLVSESQEIQMGQEYDPQIVAQMGLYGDSAIQRYVRNIGMRMAAQSERPNLPWTFRVIDDPIVNAFAVPGGFIYVTRGILAYLDSEAQLAAVVGHEIGHVTARHSVSQMSRAQLAQIGLVVGSVVSPEIAGVADVAGAGLQVLFLKYGRDDERQSDELGIRYMRRVDYDIREMPGVFTLLESVSAAQGGGRIPEWLSTHPAPEDRRERIEAIIASLPPDSLGRIVDRADYVQQLDGLVFGDDPREGFFRASEFLHPALRFRLTFPQGWKTVNQKQAVIGVSQAQDAVIQLTLAQQSSAAAAAQAFAGQEGITAGSARRTTINGLTATTFDFTANTQSGAVSGTCTHIEKDGSVYQILAYGVQARWSSYETATRNTAQSFQRLTDANVINVQPRRVDIVRINSAMTLAQFAQRNPGSATLDELEMLNQTLRNATIPSGSYVKNVVGQRVQ